MHTLAKITSRASVQTPVQRSDALSPDGLWVVFAFLCGRSEITSQHTAHLTGAHGAVRMLAKRVKILHEYVELVRAGQLPYDHALLREISSLTRRLPAMNSDQFHQVCIYIYEELLLPVCVHWLGVTRAALNCRIS